jgi:hypothetical protein
MPNDAIFLVSDSGELQRVEHQLYSSEDVLQALVARHPELLAGDQIDPAAPPRWLLVRREATIPDSADGADRWWLDHLLLDQFGVPTLVEVKRSSDTRIRREVVGQMLDYVANAQAYWAAGRMRQMLGDEAGSVEQADNLLAEHLSIDRDLDGASEAIDRFWNKVEANLREGNVRLLFVADELPRELKRLIEFLNEQFTKIEVLGVELRQYVGQGIKALVPRVVGQTEAAREQKERSSPRTRSVPGEAAIDRDGFLADISPDVSDFFAKVLDEAAKKDLQITWGRKGFSIRKHPHSAFLWCYLPSMYREGAPALEIYFAYIQKEPSVIEELRRRMSHISSIITPGNHTIRLYVTKQTLPSAEALLDIALDVMQRQP